MSFGLEKVPDRIGNAVVQKETQLHAPQCGESGLTLSLRARARTRAREIIEEFPPGNGANAITRKVSMKHY
jgi:hypothetical protein